MIATTATNLDIQRAMVERLKRDKDNRPTPSRDATNPDESTASAGANNSMLNQSLVSLARREKQTKAKETGIPATETPVIPPVQVLDNGQISISRVVKAIWSYFGDNIAPATISRAGTFTHANLLELLARNHEGLKHATLEIATAIENGYCVPRDYLDQNVGAIDIAKRAIETERQQHALDITRLRRLIRDYETWADNEFDNYVRRASEDKRLQWYDYREILWNDKSARCTDQLPDPPEGYRESLGLSRVASSEMLLNKQE